MISASYTPAEFMVAAMAREIEDGDCLAQGIGTTLPACAYFLAKYTHAPDCIFLYSVGGAFSVATGPISLSRMETLALASPLRRVGYAEIVCDILPVLRFKEFSRPAQVDGFGSTNNVVIRQNGGRELRLPGVGGIPDFSGYDSHHSYLYVPRQDVRTLVAKLDFCSGVGADGGSTGPHATLLATGRGTRRLVTDLAVIEFERTGARVVSVHPGISRSDVRERCGFRLELSDDTPETPAPTAEQLRLIRNVIDPRSIRDLELMAGKDRMSAIREILRAEDDSAGDSP